MTEPTIEKTPNQRVMKNIGTAIAIVAVALVVGALLLWSLQGLGFTDAPMDVVPIIQSTLLLVIPFFLYMLAKN